MEKVERKLASVRRVVEVKSIEGADFIQAIRVDGWWVVTRKDEFTVGDLVVYLEVDSWVPKTLAPFLCSEDKPRIYKDIEGERLRTVKLRGQLSQGLVLPLTVLPFDDVVEGQDVTELLGVIKWERDQKEFRGSKGEPGHPFPSFIPKTDQERIQNKLKVLSSYDMWEVSLKLDGSSMTVYFQDGVFGVCSRNCELDPRQDNHFTTTAKKVFADHMFDNIAIQGELMGPGIQGNRERFDDYQFFVFDIFDLVSQKYWKPSEVRKFCQDNNLQHVPVIWELYQITSNLESMLEWADVTKSINNPVAEGLVFKREDGQDSFKVISNKFLLREK